MYHKVMAELYQEIAAGIAFTVTVILYGALDMNQLLKLG
jgi:hypothetical protein